MDAAKDFEYNFDPEKNKRPSSREKRPRINDDDRLPRRKKNKASHKRRKTANPRRNRPYPSVEEMSLECCTANTCLLNQGRRIIGMIRKDFDSKLYEQQNSYLNSLIDVNPKDERNTITYNIRDMFGLRKVKVCKKAFLKIMGVGKKRIAVLVKKTRPYSGDVEQDKRQYSNRNAKKLSLAIKAEV